MAAGLASTLLPRIGPRPLMVGGTAASAVGMALFTQIKVDSSFVSHVLPAEIVMSLGMGFAFVALSSTALIGVDDRDAGVASALVNTTQQVGGSLGTALLNTIAATATVHYIRSHGAGSASPAAVHGYTVAFTWGLGALILAAVLSLVLVTKQRPPAADQDDEHRDGVRARRGARRDPVAAAAPSAPSRLLRPADGVEGAIAQLPVCINWPRRRRPSASSEWTSAAVVPSQAATSE